MSRSRAEAAPSSPARAGQGPPPRVAAAAAPRRSEDGAPPASLPSSDDGEEPASPGAPLPVLSERERAALRLQLAANFQSLVFHREGYVAADVPLEAAIRAAAAIEARAYAYVCRAAEAGSSLDSFARVYAKEASALLLAEVDKHTSPADGPRARRSAPGQVDSQGMSLNEIAGGLPSIQTAPAAAPAAAARASRGGEGPWGWLVPGSRMLPYVVLKGAGVAIGRGKEALWAVGGGGGSGGSTARGTPRSLLAIGGDRQLSEALARNLGFVEVADGRVSRLHCIISLRGASHAGGGGGGGAAAHVAVLEDCSSNGTFINGRKIGKGETVTLAEGDRISLVSSVAPLVEQFFHFRAGDPRDFHADGSEEHVWLDSAGGASGIYSPPAGHSPCPGGAAAQPASIFRTATSRYTTAEQSTLEDLRCQICLGTLSKCVALEPCGHNFCAPCLSHHLASQLQGGLQLTCPFRCPPPERIVINYAVRALVELLAGGRAPASANGGPGARGGGGGGGGGCGGGGGGGGGGAAGLEVVGVGIGPRGSGAHGRPAAGLPGSPPSDGSGSDRRAGSVGPGRADSLLSSDAAAADYYTQSMSPLCPLDDEHLPMEAASLKSKQVEVALQQLRDTEAAADVHQSSLESLARLAWSDDEVREAVASGGGVRGIVDVLLAHSDDDGIVCNACLALMSLVRGESEVCQSNQWHIAKAGAIEAVARAMRRFPGSAMVQLSVLLAFIPLALENAMMQAHITQEALPDIVAALDAHPGELDIQTKGLVLLGVLIQGDDAVHDAIRQRELEAAVPWRVVRALASYGGANDDVLWAALFVLAVLIRDSSSVFASAAAAVARAGGLEILGLALRQYRQRFEAEGQEPDEMITSAGDYLINVLAPAHQRLRRRRALLLCASAACAAAAAYLAWQDWREWRAEAAAAAAGGGSSGGGGGGGGGKGTNSGGASRALVGSGGGGGAGGGRGGGSGGGGKG
ncbi:hypothetical protein Rsub_01894 [Raphidocelis subcapitata]|uniref:E3 ubiquitin-protein ligase CHFR n=1 Tax=Raphidocelis subcapitata TaxID=307507 RepID=A0A2V0NW60_9CHLO|nr:hypothetical protein Rsub_01894 [Raphidocelis subcapitata]|eukprot:GBF89177.1 hypothetical protein Rsub_01894 [Raphidocelis subcapitata]